jgi:hypothetical protein
MTLVTLEDFGYTELHNKGTDSLGN